MRRPGYYSLAVILFILFAFRGSSDALAWPFSNKSQNTQKPKPQSSPSQSQSSKTSGDAASVKLNGPDMDTEELPLIPQLPQIPKIPSGKIAIPTMPALPPTVLRQDPDIAKIQKQIQEIIKINDSLKSNYAGQAEEIQKISEQARIHQKILKDLEAARNRQVGAKANPQKFMDLEKVKLIEKETNKNNQFLNNLKNQETSKKTQPVPQEAKPQQT